MPEGIIFAVIYRDRGKKASFFNRYLCNKAQTQARWLRIQASSDSVIRKYYVFHQSSLVAQTVKNPPTMQETRVRSLDWEDPLMVTHSSILAWRIPTNRAACCGGAGRGLQSMGSQRVGHDWVTKHTARMFFIWLMEVSSGRIFIYNLKMMFHHRSLLLPLMQRPRSSNVQSFLWILEISP